MADRFPLVANSSTNQIQEIPHGDTLDLSGNNVNGIGIITATTFSGNLTGNVTGNANVTGNVAASGNVSGVNVTASGNVTAVDGTFSGNLTVQGTTTTIDTAVTSVDSLQIDGNVGIGTTNATSALDVRNGVIVKDQDTTQNSANPGLQLKHNGTINGSWRHDGRLEIGGQDANANIRLNPDGSVGIGTDNTTATGVSRAIRFKGSSSSSGVSALFAESYAGTAWFGFYSGSSTTDTPALLYPFNGALRIGTTNSVGTGGFSEKLRIGSSGQIGLSGTNYGTAGQVLTSQGSTSAPQWATPSASGTSAGTRYTNPNTTTLSWTSLPANIQTMEVGYADAYASTNNAQDERIVLRLGTSGGYVTSNYKNRTWNMYASSIGLGFNSSRSAFIPYYWIDSSDRATNIFILRRMGTTNTFQATWQEFIAGGHSYIAMGTGYVDLGAELTQVRLQTINANAVLNGSFWMNYTVR